MCIHGRGGAVTKLPKLNGLAVVVTTLKGSPDLDRHRSKLGRMVEFNEGMKKVKAWVAALIDMMSDPEAKQIVAGTAKFEFVRASSSVAPPPESKSQPRPRA